MDWFEQLFGFPEDGPEPPSRGLVVEGSALVSRVNGARFEVGAFSTPSLAELRETARRLPDRGPTSVAHEAIPDVLTLHAHPENAGAMFQAASQFNALEFASPAVTPEDGVTGYAFDRTQGPACALATAPAAVWRNWFLPLPGGVGQRRDRQLNLLAGLEAALWQGATAPLWEVRNGYTFASPPQLAAVSAAIARHDREALTGHLRIAVHCGAEVAFASRFERPVGRPRVSQAFCAALSVAYAGGPREAWEPWARLVLDAAYEATLLAAALDRDAPWPDGGGAGSGRVWLTYLGGGVFGNAAGWIDDAIGRAIARAGRLGLDVRVAHYRRVDPARIGALEAAIDRASKA
jgi:hypothetical protein